LNLKVQIYAIIIAFATGHPIKFGILVA